MKEINLRDFYPWYMEDVMVEVTEEVAEELLAGQRYIKASRRRVYRNKAHFSLDAEDGIEYSACFSNPSPQELIERMERFEHICHALNRVENLTLFPLYQTTCFFIPLVAPCPPLLSCLEKEPLKWQALVRLLVDTGIRRGECCGLQWKDVDFGGNTITVAGNLCYTPQKGIYLDTPKNGKTRTIDVDPAVIALLQQLRLQQAEHAISAFVFTQDDSPKPMHPQSPTRYLKKFAERYEIDDLHPHKLRHSFASIAITNGADIASVSEKLGHSDKAVTLRMYTHADAESMRRASQIFREALKKTAQ